MSDSGENMPVFKNFGKLSICKQMVMVIAIILAPHVAESQDAPVTLISTLKQGSLCPGDGGATFTCTCRGTDLTWIVSGRMMSYNRNALVGAVRSNADSNETAILLRVDRLDDSGLANRVSVLTIKEKEQVTQPVTVQCHNGSLHEVKAMTFWQTAADPPGIPRFVSAPAVIDKGINITWSLDQDSDRQTIDHYILQVNGTSTMSVENTSLILYTTDKSSSYNITIRAVDECGQKGAVLSDIILNTEEIVSEITQGADDGSDPEENKEKFTSANYGPKPASRNLQLISISTIIHFITL